MPVSFYGVGPEPTLLTGLEFYDEARQYEGKSVQIIASVLESHYFKNDFLDGTLILVAFYGSDPIPIGVVYLPDGGLGVEYYLPGVNIQVAGNHNGYETVPENIFEFFPNVGEDLDLPLLLADSSLVFCREPIK